MNKIKKAGAATTALLMTLLAVNPVTYAADSASSYDMGVTVNVGSEGKAISPYIYGINEHGLDKNLQVNSVRQGGNRFSGYNWETNASNAGSDWKHSSDTHISASSDPADGVRTLSKEAKKGNIDYKLATVQMCGYVSADTKGTVEESEVAPSARWNEVIAAKGKDLSLTPDLTDGKVYMDEYVNYVVQNFGDAESETGIQGWSLDNEPGLWHHTHSRMHPEEVTAEELVKKSVDTAKAVKSVDPKAEIFGPALFGYTAFVQLSAKDGSTDWKTVNADGKYDWFISYYLEQMKKAEEESGERLLDVLDVHYYSEAKCPECDTRMCGNPEHKKGIDEMTQSYRTLIEKDYKENSWIGEYCQQNIPILTKMKESIDKYYPGTKLAVTEYDFGGGEAIAGAIAEVDALGTFAKNDVYLATLWADDVPYQYSAINLFTNYDGEGSAFGNTLLEAETEDYIKSTVYASIEDNDQGTVSVILTNKDQDKTENANIDLKGSKTSYKNAAVYILSGDSKEIIHKVSINDIKDNKLTVEIPPLSIAEVVVSDDEKDYKPVAQKTEPVFEYVDGTVTKGKEAGYFGISFDEAIAGNPVVLDIELKDTQSAMGCIDFNVQVDGTPYWVHYDWSAKTSGKVELTLDEPTGVMDVSGSEGVEIKDEAVIAKVAEAVKKSNAKSTNFQTWYVADAAWEDTDHSLVTLKGAQIKKASEGAAPAAKTTEIEGTVKADAEKAGNYDISFPEKTDGGKIVAEIDIKDNTFANGCVDTSVKYKGTDYWVHYNWDLKKSGKIEIDLSDPAVMDPSTEKDTDDEEIIKGVADLIKDQKKFTFQTWYVNNSAGDQVENSEVTLKSAKLVKAASSAEPTTAPTTTPTEEPTVKPTTEPTTEPTKEQVEKFAVGDIDGSGIIDVTDITTLSLYLIGDTNLSAEALKAADVNGDGEVRLTDLATLRQYVSKIPGVKLG